MTRSDFHSGQFTRTYIRFAHSHDAESTKLIDSLLGLFVALESIALAQSEGQDDGAHLREKWGAASPGAEATRSRDCRAAKYLHHPGVSANGSGSTATVPHQK